VQGENHFGQAVIGAAIILLGLWVLWIYWLLDISGTGSSFATMLETMSPILRQAPGEMLFTSTPKCGPPEKAWDGGNPSESGGPVFKRNQRVFKLKTQNQFKVT
jgi:hypothetical protein